MKFKVVSQEGYVVDATVRLDSILAVVPVKTKAAPDRSRIVLAGGELVVEMDPVVLGAIVEHNDSIKLVDGDLTDAAHPGPEEGSSSEAETGATVS